MMEAVRTYETSVDNHFTRQYTPEDNSEHHTRRRENLKSHKTKELGKNCPSATLSILNSTWTDLVANSGLLGRKAGD
jgi:hypothetical protein